MSPLLTNGHAGNPMSRRTALIASSLGVSAYLNNSFSPAQADSPAEQRLIQSIGTRTIQLDSISANLSGTIIRAIAADPQGDWLAVAGDDHAIRIMRASTLEIVQTLKGHSDLIRTLDFSPSGKRLVSAGNDRQLMIWQRESEFAIQKRFGGAPALACVRFAPDGHEIAAVGFENQVYRIGRVNATDQAKVECDCADLRAVAYRGDGQILAVAGRSGYLHLFDRQSNQLLGEYSIHNARVTSLRFVASSPVVVSAGEDGSVTVFDTQAKQKLQTIKVTRGKLFSVCALDQQHLAVAGSDNVIRVVNVPQGRVVEDLKGHTGSIAALACVGSFLFSGGYDATLRRWQLSGIQGGRDRIAGRENQLER